MRKRAYHSLVLHDGTAVEGPLIVQFDDNEQPAAYRILTQEEADTEWVGGTYAFPEPEEPAVHNRQT